MVYRICVYSCRPLNVRSYVLATLGPSRILDNGNSGNSGEYNRPNNASKKKMHKLDQRNRIL